MDSLRRDGTVIPQEINNRLIEYDGETAVLSIGRDISERRRTEKALKDSERKYRMLFEEFPDGIAQLDKYGTIIVCNEKFENFTGSHENEKLIFNLLKPFRREQNKRKKLCMPPEVPVHCDIKYISSLKTKFTC
jgi:PAS domain-containing protein